MTQAILADWQTAPINEKLRVTLGFLEKLTISPGEIVPEDIGALQNEGISEKTIADAIYVCVGFNIINRIADALNVKIPSPRMFSKASKFLLIVGYRILSGLGFDNIRSQFIGNKQFEQIKNDNELIASKGAFDSFANLWRQLNESVFEGPGFLDTNLRKAAGAAGDIPEVLATYLNKVMQSAAKITDEDFVNLRQANYSEDQIFEITVCAALNSGSIRLESGLNLLSYQYSVDPNLEKRVGV